MSFLLEYSPERLTRLDPKLGLGKWSQKGSNSGVSVKPHQYIPLYLIATSCVYDYEDETRITSKERYRVVRICLFGDRGGSAQYVTLVATLQGQLGRDTMNWLKTHDRHRDQFLENTQSILDLHKEKLVAAGLRVRIRGA